MNLTDKDVELLNSKIGLRYLFSKDKINLEKVIQLTKYERELLQLQEELVRLQTWVIENKKKVLVLFEGRDLAGKGGAIRRIIARINPRFYRTEALPIPTEEEALQWYFQRYVNKLPGPSEIVFFDRSWYNRAILEPVNKFCSKKEYDIFMRQVNEFERMLIESDIYLIKFYFSITKEEQTKRLHDIKRNPIKRWKISKIDEKASDLWDEYTKYKDKMFEHTNTDYAPWKILDANIKLDARLNAIKHILKNIPYQ